VDILKWVPSVTNGNLAIVSLAGNLLVDEHVLKAISASSLCNSLRELDVSYCENLCDSAFAYLAACPNLRKLNAGGAPIPPDTSINDRTSECFRYIAQIGSLRHLIVHNYSVVCASTYRDERPHSFRVLAEGAIQLRVLDLFPYYYSIHARELVEISKMKRLEVLCVRILTRIMEYDIRTMLLPHMPWLHHVGFEYVERDGSGWDPTTNPMFKKNQ